MSEQEKSSFAKIDHRNRLTIVISRGRVVIDDRDGPGIPFEKLSSKEAKDLFKVLHIEIYSDGAGS